MTRIDDNEILRLLATGATAQEIADELHMKVRTVNFRLQLLYARYGIPAGKNRNIKLIAKYQSQ
jgi:DNA-binding NarL/FixJ family response regulator